MNEVSRSGGLNGLLVASLAVILGGLAGCIHHDHSTSTPATDPDPPVDEDPDPVPVSRLEVNDLEALQQALNGSRLSDDQAAYQGRNPVPSTDAPRRDWEMITTNRGMAPTAVMVSGIDPNDGSYSYSEPVSVSYSGTNVISLPIDDFNTVFYRWLANDEEEAQRIDRGQSLMIIYTDAESSEDASFADVYRQAYGSPTMNLPPEAIRLQSRYRVPDIVMGMNQTDGSLEISTSGTDWWALVPASEEIAEGEETAFDVDGSFMASLQGVEGTVTCTSSDASDNCYVETDVSGEIAEMTTGGAATWSFLPDDEEAMLTNVALDEDYLDFGFWFRSSIYDGSILDFVPLYNGVEYVLSHDPAYAADSIDGRTVVDDLSSLTGTASYAGPATGLYVATDPDGVRVDGGQFGASAELTADFDAETIEGKISDFSDGNSEISDWELNLDALSFAEYDVLTSHFGGGETSNADGNVVGSWEMMFYGPNCDGCNPGTDTGYTALAPSAVGGAFDADFDDGIVIGAFGARQASSE